MFACEYMYMCTLHIVWSYKILLIADQKLDIKCVLSNVIKLHTITQNVHMTTLFYVLFSEIKMKGTKVRKWFTDLQCSHHDVFILSLTWLKVSSCKFWIIFNDTYT